VAVARELTKLHEEIWRGTIPAAIEHFTQNEPRGEFTLVVGGKKKEEVKRWAEEKVLIAVKFGLKLGESPSVLAKRVALESGWERREVYNLLQKKR
jgi:16S rRNA (cytidine1402-2'-O)-methyltransferase